MKPQAWGWLAAAVLAAGLNSSYHNGGLEWAHRIAGQMQHNAGVVLALATGNADRFLADAQLASAHNSPSCPMTQALEAVRRSIAPARSEQDQLEVMTARQEAAFAKLEANRARMEAQFAHLNMTNFNPVTVRFSRVNCSRVHVSVPNIPAVRMPAVNIPSAPVVHIEYSGAGPV